MKTETEIPAKDRQIPDLWKIAQIPELKGYSLGGFTAPELIKACWHQCHELQQQIRTMDSARGHKVIRFYRYNGREIVHTSSWADFELILALTGQRFINSAMREMFRDLSGGAITWEEVPQPRGPRNNCGEGS